MSLDVIKYAPNYDEIVNFNWQEDDFISKRIINYYQEFLLGIVKANIKKIKILDQVIYEYIKNPKFFHFVQTYLKQLEISSDGIDYYENLDINLPKLYKRFQTNSLEHITTTRWL